jgi:hypothetical protein
MVLTEDLCRCSHAQRLTRREEVARHHSINPGLARPAHARKAARHAVGALFVPATQPYLEEISSATGGGCLNLAACQPGITVDTLFATCVWAIGR